MKTTSDVLASEKIHDGWLPLLELAAREVFDMMLGTALGPDASSNEERFDFTAMVGLAGSISGMVKICCDKKGVDLITSKMLGASAGTRSSLCHDAMGELCNMVAGNFKGKLAGGDGVMLSAPTVVSGENYSVNSMSDAFSLQTRMSFDHNLLLISIELDS